jgi:hypothetical protein
MDVGSISIQFPFTGLLFRTEIFGPIWRLPAHAAPSYQLVIETGEVFSG